MMRGGGNRNMRRMMDKMGLDMEEVHNVQEVIIKTDKKEIILADPSVTKMSAQNNVIFTVTTDGTFEEKELEVPVFPDTDIELVCAQANVDQKTAISALTETKGDIAQAILVLKTN